MNTEVAGLNKINAAGVLALRNQQDANKLLVAFDSRVETYHSQVPVFCRENAQHSMTREFVHRRTNLSDGWVTQQLFGRATWLIA